MGKGLIIWGSTNLLMGWSSGFFGIIVKSEKDLIHNVALNVVGVVFAVISLIFSMKIETSQPQNQNFEPMITLINDQIHDNQ